MRQIWELFRVLWIVGSLPVGALLLVVVVLCGFNLPFFWGLLAVLIRPFDGCSGLWLSTSSEGAGCFGVLTNAMQRS